MALETKVKRLLRLQAAQDEKIGLDGRVDLI